MGDYSDLIFLVGAIIVFSMLSLQASRTFQLNNLVQINAEIEYNAVSIAQNEIDQIRWIKSASVFNSHVNSFPKQVPLIVENDTLWFTVELEASDFSIPNTDVTNKKVTVTVYNEYLKTNRNDSAGDRFIQLQYIKSFV